MPTPSLRDSGPSFSEYLFLALGGILGALLHWGAMLLSPDGAKAVGDPWEALGAIATTVAAIAAVVGGFLAYKGFARWETLRRKERQANFAEEAFLLTLDVWDYLRRGTVNLAHTKPESFHKEGSTLWDNLHNVELIERLYTARQRLQLYLPHAGDAGALKLWTRYEDLYRILNMNLDRDVLTGESLCHLYDVYTGDDAWLFDELDVATAYFRSYAMPE